MKTAHRRKGEEAASIKAVLICDNRGRHFSRRANPVRKLNNLRRLNDGIAHINEFIQERRHEKSAWLDRSSRRRGRRRSRPLKLAGSGQGSLNPKLVAAILKALRKAGTLNDMDLKAKVPSITSKQLKLMRRDKIIRLGGNGWVVVADMGAKRKTVRPNQAAVSNDPRSYQPASKAVHSTSSSYVQQGPPFFASKSLKSDEVQVSRFQCIGGQ